MNKRAFTLVELLAVIVLLAVVMMLIVPMVTNLAKQNEKKQYETYTDMMIEYSKSMTIKTNYVCLSDLNLKPISEDTTCNGYVTIINNKRQAFLKCLNEEQEILYQSNNYNLPSSCKGANQ